MKEYLFNPEKNKYEWTSPEREHLKAFAKAHYAVSKDSTLPDVDKIRGVVIQCEDNCVSKHGIYLIE